MKQNLWLALHFLRYEWREKLLFTLALAIFIGVGSLATINFFASSVTQAMDAQTGELLGADWLVESSQPLPAEQWSARAADFDLESASTTQFLSMAGHDHQLQLASIKAVDEAYPLRGQLYIRNDIDGPEILIASIPEPGEVWLAARMLPALGIDVGDQITIGAADFEVAGIISREPDVGIAFFATAPRILMNAVDLPQAEVLDVGSRANYRFLVSGNRDDIETFAQIIQAELNAQQQVIDNMSNRPELVAPVENLFKYLNLAALFIFLLSALAVALATRAYAERQTDASAIIRCLGATKRDMLTLYLSSLLLLTVLASIVACLFGYMLSIIFIELAASWWQVGLPYPGVGSTLLISILTGVILVLGFAWPWLLNLQNVPPLRVLKRQMSPPPVSSYLIYGSMAAALYVLFSVYQTPLLTGWMVFTVFLVLGSFAIITDMLLKAVGRLGQRLRMPWRLGLMQVTHAKRMSFTQIWVYGFLLTVVFLFVLLRQDFLNTWRDKLPDDAPNHFLVNILPEQVIDVQGFFAQAERDAPDFYPMVRARLVNINSQAVALDDYPPGEAPSVLRRDLNLTFTQTLDEHTIVQGDAWDIADYDNALISIESSMAENLDLRLGDSLGFQLGALGFQGQVASIREVDWYTMQPNFYVIMTPGMLTDLPATYISSFYLPLSDKAFLNELAQAFPNVAVFEVDAMIASLQDLIKKALVIVEVLFLIALIAVLLVLVVVQRTQADQRAFTSAVLRTLGAEKKQLLRGWLSEFALIGLLAGVVAVVLAHLLSALISERVFAMVFSLNAPLIWLGPLLAMCVYALLGLWVLRRLLRKVPVLQLAEE